VREPPARSQTLRISQRLSCLFARLARDDTVVAKLRRFRLRQPAACSGDHRAASNRRDIGAYTLFCGSELDQFPPLSSVRIRRSWYDIARLPRAAGHLPASTLRHATGAERLTECNETQPSGRDLSPKRSYPGRYGSIRNVAWPKLGPSDVASARRQN